MLTSDLVPVRRRGAELQLVAIDAKRRERARLIAGELVALAADHVGGPRGELEEALGSVPAEPRDEKLKAGLAKLTLDRCTFAAESAVDPVVLRDALFRRATAWRREGSIEPREAIVAEVGAAQTPPLDANGVEAALYSDLKSAHPLQAFEPISAEGLVAAYEEALPQAVLLRATRVTVTVKPANAGALRALLRRLKFLRLLFAIAKAPEPGAHALVVEGPLAMFDGGARYGLKLALLLPALRETGTFELEAEIRWGKEHAFYTFRVQGTDAAAARAGGEAPLPEEVQALLDGVNAASSDWRAARADAVLDLPGLGVVVPDLVLTKGKARVFVEVLGFWSREAVWRRVELAEKGLPEKVIFVASERLRVSEEVLESEHACLYVYKGVIGVRGLLERASRLA